MVDEGAPFSPFIRTLIQFMRADSLSLNKFPKGYMSTIVFSVKILIYEFGGYTSIQIIVYVSIVRTQSKLQE
jgi:hypothetical protein